MLKKLVSLLAILTLIFALAACGSNSAPATGEESPAPSDQTSGETGKEEEKPKEAKLINIGYSGPLSGPAAFYGENTLSGLQMATEEINETGFEVNGELYKINLVSLDDKYLPNETGTNARRLVQDSKTPVIFIPHSGGVFATQVFNEQDGFIIGAYTSEPKIQQQGNNLTLMIPPAYDIYPEVFTKYQMERFGNKLAVLPTATQYGKDWTETLVPVWKANGGEVVFESSIDFSKDTDFFTLLTNALSKKPDVLFVGGPSQPTALVIKQARELGFKGGFMVMDQAKFEEMGAVLGGYSLLEGAIGALPIIDSDAPGGPGFKTAYEAKFGKIPTAEGAFNYQALHVVVHAMKAAGTVTDVQKIMSHMNDGVQGLTDQQMVWFLPGVENNSFSWKTAISAIEDGKIVQVGE